MKDKLPTAVPVKLAPAQLKEFAEMKRSTGLNRSILLRLAAYYFSQQVKVGKIEPLDLFKEFNGKVA